MKKIKYKETSIHGSIIELKYAYERFVFEIIHALKIDKLLEKINVKIKKRFRL